MGVTLSRRQLIAMATGTLFTRRRALANPILGLTDPSGRFVLVANPASLDVFSANRPTDRVMLTGPLGPHRVEQVAPRPVNMRFDPTGRFLIVPDTGRDRIESYRLSDTGKLTLAATTVAREGAGPCDIRFHPNLPFAYAMNGLNATIAAHRFDPASGVLTPFQIVPALPDHHIGAHGGWTIAVSPDGERVHAVHVGGVTRFAVARASGCLTEIKGISRG